MKKIITIILSIILVCAVGVTTFGATIEYKSGKETIRLSDFRDTQGHWAHDVILRWADYSIVAGDNGNFMPNKPIKRGDFCVILDRLLGLSVKSYNYFYDLSNDAYYTDAVLKCVAAGYVSGTSDTTVDPNGNATREQIAVIITRMFDLDTSNTKNIRKFADDYNIGSWARDSVYAMRAAGYMNGNGNNMFNPKSNITRAEIMQVLNNIAGTYVPTRDIYKQGNTFKSSFSSNLMVARKIELSNSTVGKDLILTPNVNSITLTDTTINGRLFVMRQSNISLSKCSIEQIYLQYGKSKITGMGTGVNSVYVGIDASESTLDAVPSVLYLEAGTRVKIIDKFYENDSTNLKVYYGKDINEAIADEQGFVVGGPKIKDPKITQNIENILNIENLRIVTGDYSVKEIGIVWNDIKENSEVKNPTYTNCVGRYKYPYLNVSEAISFDFGPILGNRIYRVYVKDNEGLYAYSKPFEFKAYDFKIDMKLYDNDYPKKIDVDIVFTGDNVPEMSNVTVISGMDEVFGTERKNTSLRLYSEAKSEYEIDGTTYKRYTGTISSSEDAVPTYFGYTITFKDKTIYNKYPVLFNVLPEGVSPMAKLSTGNAKYKDSKIVVADSLVSTKYIVPQEIGVIIKSSDNVIEDTPSAGKNGWSCVPYSYQMSVNESKYFSVSFVPDLTRKYTNYAVYVKTSDGYWYGDIYSILNDETGNSETYKLESTDVKVIGDTEAVIEIHKKLGSSLLQYGVSLDFGGAIGVKSLSSLEYTSFGTKQYVVLRDLEPNNIYSTLLRVIDSNGEYSNAIPLDINMRNKIGLGVKRGTDESSNYVFNITMKNASLPKITDVSLIGSNEVVVLEGSKTIKIPKTVNLYNTKLEIKFEYSVGAVTSEFTQTFNLY